MFSLCLGFLVVSFFLSVFFVCYRLTCVLCNILRKNNVCMTISFLFFFLFFGVCMTISVYCV